MLEQAQFVIDEIVSNVVKFGDATSIEVHLHFQPDSLSIVVSDNGVPFDPLTRPEPNTTLDLHEREVGGLGIHLVKEVMSDVNYEYVDGRNVLTMKYEP